MKRQAWTTLVSRPGSDYATLYHDLDGQYLLMLRRVDVEFRPDASEDHLLRAQIQLVIWGCLMIESVTNRLRRQVLRDMNVPPPVLDDYWKRVERDPIAKKLKVVSKHFSFEIPDWLSGEIDLRNRLAHYKSEGAVFNREEALQQWKAKGGEPSAFLESLPPQGIHADLIAVPAAERQARYLAFGKEILMLAIDSSRAPA